MVGFFSNVGSALSLVALIGATVAWEAARPSGTSAGGEWKNQLRETRVERLPAPILSLDVSPRSDLAVAALSDGRVRVWHLETGDTVHEFRFGEPETDMRQKDEGEVEPIRVHFAPDGKTLAASHLSRVYLYDTHTWLQVKALGVEGEDVMRPLPRPQLSPRPAVEKKLDDINTGTRKWVQRKTLGDGRTRVTDFAFTPDGTALAVSYCRISCYDRPGGVAWTISNGHEPVRLWELWTGRMLWEHHSGPNRITERLVVSPDGRLLVEVVFQPGQWNVELRELVTGRETHSIKLTPLPEQAPDVAFMPDSQHFVSLWNEPRKIWQMGLFNAPDGQVVAHFSDAAAAQRVAVSPNGLWLAITTWRDVAFKLWNVEKRKPLVTIRPRVAGVHVHLLDSIRFALNGRKLVVSDRRNGLVFTYELTD